jgi:hypothetical protein
MTSGTGSGVADPAVAGPEVADGDPVADPAHPDTMTMRITATNDRIHAEVVAMS